MVATRSNKRKTEGLPEDRNISKIRHIIGRLKKGGKPSEVVGKNKREVGKHGVKEVEGWEEPEEIPYEAVAPLPIVQEEGEESPQERQRELPFADVEPLPLVN